MTRQKIIRTHNLMTCEVGVPTRGHLGDVTYLCEPTWIGTKKVRMVVSIN